MLRISIIVPTYNSQIFIEKCLKAIRRSEYKNYELIVVDGGSKDKTVSIAEKIADEVVKLKNHPNRNHVRSTGLEFIRGEVVVNIDSDVIIRPDTLSKIGDYFVRYPGIDAVTGILSKEHPNSNFFSQYKNLYMHYTFTRLPKEVTFLYGSLYAVRKSCLKMFNFDIKVADDTALGQQLFTCGKKVVLLKDLEVVHCKKHTFASFVKNDFQIPFDWANIFLKFGGWKQLGKHKTGFAHASKKQLVSVALAFFIMLLSIYSIFVDNFILLGVLFSVWCFINFGFLSFLAREKGILFSIIAFFLTFLDNIIMALGIFFGFIFFCLNSGKSLKRFCVTL